MKLLGSTKSRIKKDKNSENFPYVETKEVVLINCNAVNNSYHLYHFLYIFVPDKSFGQLLDTSPGNFISLKTFDSEFSYIDRWFTDRNSILQKQKTK